MFKIEKGKNDPLNKIAKQFYSKVNPINKSGSLKKNSLKARVSKKLRSEKNNLKKRFYKKLVGSNFKLLEKIITGDPKELTLIIKGFDVLVNANKIPPFFELNAGIYKSTKFGEEVLEVFNYKNCRGSFKFNWLVDSLDVFVCPYCNYEHTFQVKAKDDEIILHDFDHFIPKVINPYLSLSFFNLIPSCHNCNSTLKGTTVFTEQDYIHPYIDDLHSLGNFSIDKPVIGNDTTSFEVTFVEKTTNLDEIRKLNNHLSVFLIKSRYQHFKTDIVRLNRKKEDYNESYKQQLLNNGILGWTFKDRDELIEYIGDELDIPINVSSASRITKGKFKMDIATEFKIIT